MLKMSATDDYDVWLCQLARPYAFASSFSGQDFALLLVNADPNVTDEEREVLSKQIVQQGCRYAVCTGDQCSMWHDSIDLAYLATSPDFSPSDERFVMTTWHEDEPLEDVVYFFHVCTTFDHFIPRHYLALIVGGDDSLVQSVSSIMNSEFMAQK